MEDKKFDREPIGWITRNGKHIPIFDDDKEITEIKKNLKIKYAGTNKSGIDYQIWVDDKSKTRFVVLLKKDGFTISEAFVPVEYRRKGIATWFYNKIEKESKKKTGRSLIKSAVLTPFGKKFWNTYK